MSQIKINGLEDLRNKLKEADSSLAVLHFFAPWNGSHQIESFHIKNLSDYFKESVIFLNIYIDEAEEIARAYNVAIMHSFVFVKNEKILDSLSGSNFTKLKETIEKLQ